LKKKRGQNKVKRENYKKNMARKKAFFSGKFEAPDLEFRVLLQRKKDGKIIFGY